MDIKTKKRTEKVAFIGGFIYLLFRILMSVSYFLCEIPILLKNESKWANSFIS